MIIPPSPRLLLRAFTLDDVENLLACFGDPEVMRHYPATYDRGQTEDFVRRQLERYRTKGYGVWAVELRDTGTFIGAVGITPREIEGREELEIGFMLLKSFWSKGYATEAARACCEHAFSVLGLERVICLIDPANHPSQRVAERVGMTPQREVNHQGKRYTLFALSRPASA